MTEDKYKKSLEALDRLLADENKEQVDRIIAQVEEETKGMEGPTVEEYFQSINPQAQYRKGYVEGATEFKNQAFKALDKLKEQFPFDSWQIAIVKKRLDEILYGEGT